MIKKTFNSKNKLKLSICIPTFNGSNTIKRTINSILKQSYQNFEIIINDDYSKDDTEKIIKNIKDKRIKFYKNKMNLGYGKNLNSFRDKIKSDIMVLMAQDDIFLKNALLKIVRAFELDDDVGVVTRPYYQFEYDPKIPVRHWPPPSIKKDTIISINSSPKKLEAVVRGVFLVSGLAYRTKYLKQPFHEHVFTSQAYPFFSILKDHKAIFLKDYIVAVGIYESQCRFKPAIYEPSPTQTWMDVFEYILPGKKYQRERKICQNYMAQNYVGLVQIKNYSYLKDLLEEICVHIKYRPASLIDKRFWFYTLVCLFTPRFLLRKIVDLYKSKMLSKSIANKIKIELT